MCTGYSTIKQSRMHMRARAKRANGRRGATVLSPPTTRVNPTAAAFWHRNASPTRALSPGLMDTAPQGAHTS